MNPLRICGVSMVQFQRPTLARIVTTERFDHLLDSSEKATFQQSFRFCLVYGVCNVGAMCRPSASVPLAITGEQQRCPSKLSSGATGEGVKYTRTQIDLGPNGRWYPGIAPSCTLLRMIIGPWASSPLLATEFYACAATLPLGIFRSGTHYGRYGVVVYDNGQYCSPSVLHAILAILSLNQSFLHSCSCLNTQHVSLFPRSFIFRSFGVERYQSCSSSAWWGLGPYPDNDTGNGGDDHNSEYSDSEHSDIDEHS